MTTKISNPVVHDVSILHQQENKSFIEFIQKNKRLFDNSKSGSDAYYTLCTGILPEYYSNNNILLSVIPKQSMNLIRYILSCYTKYIRYIDLNGLGVGSKFSEIELELCNPKDKKEYVTIYIPISFLHYYEYDVSISNDDSIKFVNTWYVPKKEDISNSLNKVHQKLTEFDTMIGSDILCHH